MLRLPLLRVALPHRSFSAAAAGSKVGFIGLGNMGRSMAENLLKNGHSVVVFDGGCLLVCPPDYHGRLWALLSP